MGKTEISFSVESAVGEGRIGNQSLLKAVSGASLRKNLELRSEIIQSMSFMAVVRSVPGWWSTFSKGSVARGSQIDIFSSVNRKKPCPWSARGQRRGGWVAGQLGRALSSRALGHVTDFALSELSKKQYQSQPQRLGHNSHNMVTSQHFHPA